MTTKPWHTDRSRIVTGLQHCQMKRYYQYHVQGTGVTGPSTYDQALGIAIHEGLAKLMAGATLKSATKDAKDSFEGSLPLDVETDLLISGMLAGWNKVQFPKLKAEFDIVCVEEDMSVELEQNIKYMFRPDMILRRKSDGKLGVHDFKTVKSWRPDYQIDEYRRNVQMAINCIFAGVVLGEPVDHFYVHFLVKGSRKATWNDIEGDYSGPEASDSKFIYCYHQQADPPITREDWSPTFMVKGAGSRRRRLGDSYKRKTITEAGLTSEEWIEKLDDRTLYDHFPIVGPFPGPDARAAEKYTRMVVGEEVRWQNRIASITAKPEQLDYIVPRSFDCYKWGHQCEFYGTCFTGTNLAGLTPRKPHHSMEEKK